MACRRCQAVDVAGCVCAFLDSDCFNITGSGTADNPFVVEAIIDPDPLNLYTCGASGIGVFLPSELETVPTCGVARSTVQAIANGPTTLISFDVEHWDTDNMHSNVTDPTRVTFNTSGVYALAASVKWEGNASNDRRIELRVDSSDLIVSDEANMGQADDFNQSVATIWKFTAGQYVELQVKQNSGVSLNILTEGDVSPQLRVARVAAG